MAALKRDLAVANQRAQLAALEGLLADPGVSSISGSRDAVRDAMVRELLPAGTEEAWMAMIRSRNLTSHTDNQELAALQQEVQARAERR